MSSHTTENLPFSQMAFFQTLCSLAFVDWIWLYGSRARGTAKERSDIDLAIVCPAATAADWLQIEEIIETQKDTLLKIDVVRFDEIDLNDPFRLKILQDKVVLFERHQKSTDSLWRIYLYDLREALDRLDEALQAPIDPARLTIDATIQRFEFCIELFWKNFKNLAELFGKECPSPREAVMAAFAFKWINQEHLWLSMLKDRNITSHTYKKIKADEIYAHIHLYYPEMRTVYQHLEEVVRTL